MEQYLALLAKQLRAAPERCESIYIGGGTPTLFNLDKLERFTRLIVDCFKPDKDTEISIEANPETLDGEKVAFLRQYYTRLSMGVQSFDAASRRRIGRHCSQEKLLEAIELVKNAAFLHWNCDLIYSLPGQTQEMWIQDLEQTAECGVDHVSCYALTPEENSLLGGEFIEDDERETEFYHIAEKVLSRYGIERYEISNYAKPGCECRHNKNVWQGGLLCGFGPSAAGFDGRIRTIEPDSLDKWLRGEAPETDEISAVARLNEIFAVNLRTVDGWTQEAWAQVPDADAWESRIETAKKLQKIFPEALHLEPRRIKLTEYGILFWNMIAQELF